MDWRRKQERIQHESLVQSFLNETNVDIIDQIPESSQLVRKTPMPMMKTNKILRNVSISLWYFML